MKKRNRKLFSLLMVFALFMGLFCNVTTAEAADSQKCTRSVSLYDKSYYSGSIRMNITYRITGGKVYVDKLECTTSTNVGYSVSVDSKSISNGTPGTASITYTFKRSSGEVIRKGSYTVKIYTDGSITAG